MERKVLFPGLSSEYGKHGCYKDCREGCGIVMRETDMVGEIKECL